MNTTNETSAVTTTSALGDADGAEDRRNAFQEEFLRRRIVPSGRSSSQSGSSLGTPPPHARQDRVDRADTTVETTQRDTQLQQQQHDLDTLATEKAKRDLKDAITECKKKHSEWDRKRRDFGKTITQGDANSNTKGFDLRIAIACDRHGM